MRSSHSFLAREYCVLERMHEIIQKGPKGYGWLNTATRQ
ncbi:hypothetical protein HPHPP23_0798 [Helicobacter pylori Hp P-23]|nr:hypothetical protein HPHPH27_1054 [Helicobacter pylori Hp H-27]EJC12542.1 hypothetical protein HPHPP23_0798 [Helicobacter pylori Hp P-23]EJC16270.1 hypothetical protein HPHPP74_1079 [Helicobacter pylori Hp P-74]